ncbi:MAG: hypothetical protein Q8K58_00345 [Acidimicrobiales bacterium]|nr:hypothetical protein [Acidimicrobiales bacterium]
MALVADLARLPASVKRHEDLPALYLHARCLRICGPNQVLAVVNISTIAIVEVVNLAADQGDSGAGAVVSIVLDENRLEPALSQLRLGWMI